MNRRQIMKLAPLAAVSGLVMKYGEVEASAVEIDKNKQYVFMVPAACSQNDVNTFSIILKEHGINAVVVTEGVSIYEL